MLPVEYDLWCSVPPRRDVPGQLGLLSPLGPGRPKVQDSEGAVLVDPYVGRLEVPV